MGEPHLNHRTSKRPGRVLLAWEFGAGRTHVRNLRDVAARLRRQGVECLAALYRPRFAAEFEDLGIPVVQTCVWPGRRRDTLAWKERQVRGLGDVLANLGVAHPDALDEAIVHYDGLFRLFEPDLVLCENAFGAILAARDRLPAIAFGTGSCLPPRRGEGFALWPGFEHDPSWPEDDVLAGINEGLARSGRVGLDCLGDLLRIEGVYPYGPAPFDIYDGKRPEPVLPPSLPDLPRPVPVARGEEIFVYLHAFAARDAGVMQALKAIEQPLRIHVPDLPEAASAALAAKGHRIEAEPVPVADIIERSGCVLHHGGHQLSAVCLAAGLPQVILSKELENTLAGRFVEDRGIGIEIPFAGVTAGGLTSALRTARDDPAMRARARALAPGIATAWLDTDPSAIVADAALAGIARRRSSAHSAYGDVRGPL